jgi:tetratricopeptide (TPR) repeat protein
MALGQPQPEYADATEWRRVQGFTWFAAARTNKRSKRLTALSCLQKAMELIPDQHEVWYALGAEWNRLGRSAEALAPLREYLRRVPENPDGRFELAFALNALDQVTEALPILTQLSKEQPGTPFIENERGFALNHLGRPEEALAALDLGLKKASTMAGWIERSISLRMLERWDEAIDALEKAVASGLDPKLAEDRRRQILAKEKVKYKVMTSTEASKVP